MIGERLARLFGTRATPVIGLAAIRDARDLAVIHRTGFERGWDTSEFERLLADRAIVAHAARPAGRGPPTGFILSRLVLDEAEILTVAVEPRARGRGQGRMLLRLHLGRLAAIGTRSVFLEVAEDNEAALRLYLGLGFEEIGRRAGYYARPGRAPAHAIIMRRTLG
jgi:ribosomal-protein-alanine N-acetyltransferase